MSRSSRATGPDWFCLASHPDAPGTMLITVSGALGHPGVYEIEAGASVGDVLAICGGNAHPSGIPAH